MKKILSVTLAAVIFLGILVIPSGTTYHNGENKWSVFAEYQDA